MTYLSVLLFILLILCIIGSKPVIYQDGTKQWNKTSLLLLVIVFILFTVSFYSDILLVALIALCVGLLLLYVTINQIKNLICCNEAVDAKVVEFDQHSCSIIFEYYVHGSLCKGTYLISESEKNKAKYRVGKFYTIYVNPNISSEVKLKKKFDLTCLFMFLISSYLVGIGIYLIVYVFVKK